MIESFVSRMLLVAIRVGGLMTFAPFFSNASIAPLVKAGFTAFVTFLLLPVYAAGPSPSSPATWLAMAFSEAALGLLMGLTTQFVIEGMILAGQVISFQFGFSLENIIDPNTSVEITVLATLHELVALLIFLEIGAHRWLLRAVAVSFRIIPPGGLHAAHLLPAEVLRAATSLWLIGTEIAFPVIVVTMLTDFAVGFLTKASPQFPALFFGISVKALLGLAVLSAAVAFWPRILGHFFFHALEHLESLLTLAR